MADTEKPPDNADDFTEDERAFLETYAMLLRLLFKPCGVAPVRKDDAA